MKHLGKYAGRRSKSRRRTEARLLRQQQEKEDAKAEAAKKRAVAVARILPRIKKACSLSEVGVCFLEENNRRIYFSIEGQLFDSMLDPPTQVVQIPWMDYHHFFLEHLVGQRRFLVYKPKGEMQYLAEVIAGYHDGGTK